MCATCEGIISTYLEKISEVSDEGKAGMDLIEAGYVITIPAEFVQKMADDNGTVPIVITKTQLRVMMAEMELAERFISGPFDARDIGDFLRLVEAISDVTPDSRMN